MTRVRVRVRVRVSVRVRFRVRISVMMMMTGLAEKLGFTTAPLDEKDLLYRAMYNLIRTHQHCKAHEDALNGQSEEF